jgi:hypothetical protein
MRTASSHTMAPSAYRKCQGIPHWVPDKMRDDYAIVASIEGEHAAAAWARKEKRKAGL